MMSGKEKTNKQQKTTKRQKGLEYDSLNDSKRKKKNPKISLPKTPVLTTTTENITVNTADSVQ